MKPSRKLLSSVIFLCMGTPSLHAAGLITIGGGDSNITASPTFSPVSYASDATVSELSVVSALGSNAVVTVSNSGAGGAGINVISPVSWTNANSLVLNAHDNINVAAAISNFSGGGLTLTANNGGVALNGVVEFTGSINVQATAGITQDNTHILRADGLATFNAGSSDITLSGPTNNFGSLNLTGNAVTIREASASSLAAVNAGSLDLKSTGAITQTSSVQVTGLAKFDAGSNAITLSDAFNNFGTVALNGGVVTVTEQGDTDLGAVTASSLTVNSGGALTNSGNVSVTGATQLNATSINLGGGAGTASLGSLNFNATGNVSLNLVSGTTITGANTAGSFVWNTNGNAAMALGSTITATTAEIQKGSIVLSGNNQIIAGGLTVESGATFNLGTFNNTVGTYNQNGAAILAGTGTLTATTYNLNGGNVNANLGTGTINQIGTTTTTLNGTSAASAVNVNGGTLALGSSNRLSDSAAVTVNSGRLNLGIFSDTVASFAVNGGILDGSGTLTAATYDLNGGTVNANLGTGILTQIGNTTVLNGTSSAATVNINGGTLTLGASDRLANTATVVVNNGTLNLGNFNDTVGTFSMSSGSLNGTGTLTAATYGLGGGTVNANLGAGVLTQTANTTLLNGTSASLNVNITGGALSLGASERLNDAAVLNIAGGSLNLNAFNEKVGTFAINTGSLDGTGTLTASAYNLSGGAINANLGVGTLTQIVNTTILNGTSGSATLSINGGTLALGASDRLSDTAAVTLSGVGILNLNSFNDTVGTFTLNAGTLNGTGTLTATTYNLNGGTLNGNLGAGTLNHLTNTTILNGTSGAATVNINGGTLTLGASERLSDTATVSIASTGILNIGSFNDTIGTLNLNSGLLNGTGTLTATTYNLNGGTVNANLGTGTLNQLSNNTLLNGTSAASVVNVNGGTLTLGASDRLDNSAAVTVNAATTLDLGTFSDTVGSFTLNSGTLNGTGTLTATTYNLNGGTVNANLGTGTLNQLTNTTVLNGTSSASLVNVNGGTLTLGGSNRLFDSSALTVNSGTLNLGTFSDTVGTFLLNSGTLDGSGTLTATTYTLNGGTVNANLGTGTLTQIGNTTVLNGTSAASAVNVNGGTLTLGASDRLSNSAAVTVSSAILNLGTFSDTVGTFLLNSGTLNGSGTLTAATYTLNGGTVNANLGAGILTQLTNTTVLNGTSDAATVAINGGTLTLGASNRLNDSAAVTVAGTLNLGTFSDSVGTFTLNSGILNGSGTLTAATYDLNGGTVNANLGTGILTQLTGSTLLNGTSAAATVNVNGGTLALGANNRLSDSAALTVNSAILDINTFSDTVGTFALNSGTLNGSGTLTAATYTLNGGTVNANLGAGVLTHTGNTTVLNGTSAAATVNINGGTLTLGASDRLSNSAAVTVNSAILDIGTFSDTVGTFALNSGTLNGSGTLTATTYTLNGGTVNANLGAGILTHIGNTTVLNGTSGAGTVNINGGTLTLGTNNRLNDTAAVTVSSGTLNLGAFNDTVGTFLLNSGTLDGTGTLTATTYDLNGGTVNANLGTGVLTQVGNSTLLNGTSAAATVNVNGGTLTLGASDRLNDSAALTVSSAILDIGTFNDTVATFTLNSGTLNGSGTLTAATYSLNGGTVNANLGAGTLTQLTNTTLLNGTSAAATVNVNGGTLTLGASDRLLNTAAVTVNSAILDISTFNDTVGTFTLNSGTLNGSGTLTAATYSLNGGTVNANLGAGILTQLTNTTLLNGTSAAATVNVNGGTLTLGANNRLFDTAAVTVNGGTLNLGTFSDTVGTFALNSGILNGTGTLTAATYSLNGGTVNANLGTGILTQVGNNTLLNGTSGAGTVNINGGTLTLGANNRLSDSAAVTVNSSAILDIGTFSDTVGTFTLNAGTLNGTGTLTAATYSLNGGTVNANLGTGILTQLTNTTLLNGTSAAATVNVNGGTLTLGASDRLSDSAAVTVNSAIINLGTFSDTVGSFALNSGTLNGSGTLTAATYTLNGGTVNANLGAGVLTHTGNTTVLNGTSGAATVNINGGTLTLGASDRLSNSAAVTVSSATLNLGTFSDTVGTFALNSGTLDGSGTLTAATYDLSGGTVNANLGTGILNQLANVTTLNGTSAAATVNVHGGTLALGASNRLSNIAAVTVNTGILDLGTFSDTVGTFALNSGTLNGTGTLTAATYDLSGGTVNANLGNGILTQLANVTTLNGTSSAATVNVNGGTLTLGANNRLNDSAVVTVNSAILDIGTFNDTVGTFTLNSGTLDGTGTLTAATYTLNGGTVNANLGTGVLSQLSNNTLLNGTSAAATVNVNGGTLTLGASDRLSDSSAVTVNAATLDIATFSDTVGTFTLNAGTLNGSGTLTAATYSLNGGTVNANLGTGTLNQLTATTTLNGTSAASVANVNGGTLILGASDRLSDSADLTVNSGVLNIGSHDDTVGTFTLNAGTLNGTGTLTAATYDLNGGTVNANLGSGTLNQLTSSTVLNGTSGATAVNVTGGTLTLGSSERFNDSAALKIAGGTLSIGGFDETVATFALQTGNLNGTGLLTATTYSLNGGTINADLGTGTLNQLSNTTTLNGTSAAGIMNVTGGTLALGASDRLDDLAALTLTGPGTLNLGNHTETIGAFTLNGGSLDGSGTLTATTYDLNGGTINAKLGDGTLNQLGNITTLNGTSGSLAVNITGGTLALGASNRFADNATVSVETGATLNIGLSNDRVETFNLHQGELNGSGTLTATNYHFEGGTVNANLGTGIITQVANTTTLNGKAAVSQVRIDGGTLALGASTRLARTTAVTVNSATFDLGSFDDTVGSVVLNSGTIDGTGKLTASTYTLNGGVVNADLGAGTLVQRSEATTLNGSSLAGTVNINGGSLTLGSSNRLLNQADVRIASGSLELGAFNDTIEAFFIEQGSLNGTGTLTATYYNLYGGTVNANLGAGVLKQRADTTFLNGESNASSVKVSGGTLTLGASNRLSDSAKLNVGVGTLDIADFNEKVGILDLNSGSVIGTGTLTAASYNLYGGTITANLGQGNLSQYSGSTTLVGTSGAKSVNIHSGVLKLGGSDLLADNATVSLFKSGTLDTGTFKDTVRNYSQKGSSELAGEGELLVTKLAKLKGGTVSGNLLGDVTSVGSVLITGSVGGGELQVNSGDLTVDGLIASDTVIRNNARLAGTGDIDGDLTNLGALSVGAKGGDLTITGALKTSGTVELSLQNAKKFESITADSIRFGGKLVVVNKGVGLAKGETVQIFKAGTYLKDFKSFVAIGFDNAVRFDEATGTLIGLGSNSSHKPSKLVSKPKTKDKEEAAALLSEKPAASDLRIMAKAAAPSSLGITPELTSDSPAGEELAAALLTNPVAQKAPANNLSPEVYRGIADYTEQALRSHVKEAEQAPVSRVGSTQTFATTHGTSSGVDGSATDAGYDVDIFGVTVGMRQDIGGCAQIGALLGYNNGNVDGSLISTDVDGFVFGAFGSYLLDEHTKTKLTASATYGSFDSDATRRSAGGSVHADGIGSDAFEFNLGISTAAYQKNGLTVTPSAVFRYTTGNVDGFTENGVGTGLVVDSQDISSPLLDFAVDFNYAVRRDFTLVGHVGYTFDFDDSNESVGARLNTVGSTPFTASAPGIDNDAFVLGLGAYYDINENTRVGLNYRADFRTDSETSQSIGIGLSYGF
ncbi:MAG: hypothetical protein V4689_09375 [Verrucomicrobiota bacterium]